MTSPRSRIGEWWATRAEKIAGDRVFAVSAVIAITAVLAVMAVGVLTVAKVAQDALGLNQRNSSQVRALQASVAELHRQSAEQLAEIAALRQQVRSLGAQPVEVRPTSTTTTTAAAHRRATTTTTPRTTTTRPPPPPSATTTTTAPCRIALPHRCVVPG